MADVKNEIDLLVKRDEAATRQAIVELADAADSVDEQTRKVAKQAFDRIKAAREARDRKRVKKTD